MKKRIYPFALTCLALLGALSMYAQQRLVWADEFDYSGLPDPSRWTYDVGDGCPRICGWGNNELQYYTEKTCATPASKMATS